jgi:peptidyl-prolyl cis-trans isomerase C
MIAQCPARPRPSLATTARRHPTPLVHSFPARWALSHPVPKKAHMMMMKKQLIAVLAGGVIAAVAAPALAQNVAIVNGKAVPTSRVTALAKQMERAGRPVPPEMQGALKEEVITREVFLQEAKKLGLDTTPEFREQMEQLRQQVLIRDLRADYLKKNPVTDAQAKAEYDKFVAANAGKEYRARHILVETEPEAQAIMAALAKGEKFEELAKKSKDPGSGANGGDLDWAAPGSYVKEFSDAMVALQKGQTTTAPVKSQFGYHIIRLDDTRDAQLPAFDDVKPQILQQLTQQREGEYLQGLRAKARVQ